MKDKKKKGVNKEIVITIVVLVAALILGFILGKGLFEAIY